MNTPRYPSAKYIFEAFNKEFKVITYNDLLIDQSTIGLKGSPTNVKQVFTKQAIQKAKKVELSPVEAAEKIISEIEEFIGGKK